MLAALQSQGVDAHAFDPAERELVELRHDGFARCFIALHGRHGEDGTVQGALELLRIPYTGSGVMASAIAMDKVMTKRLWLAEGLPTPRCVNLKRSEQGRERVIQVPDELGLPLIVKPPREGSSIGVTKVQGYSQMQDAVALAGTYDDEVMCEEFIEGDELTCPVLGEGDTARALPVIRIVAPEGAYDYQNKYFTDVTQYLVPERPAGGRGGRDPAHRRRGLPLARLPRLGACRPDGARRRPQALPARDEHQPRHDLALAGADVGQGGRDQLRAAVPAPGGDGRPGRLNRWPAPPSSPRRCQATSA